MSENNFLKGLVVGGLLGLAAGLLFAPKSGKETRADICNRTEELLRAAKEEYEKGVEKTSELYQTARADISGIAESGKQKIEETGSRLKQAVDAGVKAFTEAKQE
jgi:gas vesicle protein